MEIGDKGLELIIESEGFESEPYQDSVGVWTIGFGTTRLFGKPVSADTAPIDRDTALKAIGYDLIQDFEPVVNDCVEVELNQNQYDALVCFVYNIGSGAFRDSTLLRKLNAGDYDGAADEFLRWKYAGGEVLRGLEIRREKERQLFLT